MGRRRSEPGNSAENGQAGRRSRGLFPDRRRGDVRRRPGYFRANSPIRGTAGCVRLRCSGRVAREASPFGAIHRACNRGTRHRSPRPRAMRAGRPLAWRRRREQPARTPSRAARRSATRRLGRSGSGRSGAAGAFGARRHRRSGTSGTPGLAARNAASHRSIGVSSADVVRAHPSEISSPSPAGPRRSTPSTSGACRSTPDVGHGHPTARAPDGILRELI